MPQLPETFQVFETFCSTKLHSSSCKMKNIVCDRSEYIVIKETMISILGEKEAMKLLGERFRKQRLRKNLSQAHLSEMIGISLPTYRKIEQGEGTVEFRHVARALGALGFSEALGNLIPEPEIELKLKDLLAPERKNASPKSRK
jgi:DNA-binding XRE family transcriptional regulator